ncbi:MAG TPA: decaprenyl-phosphate phosphoribosyltransferase [Patescibacteria group bacterium]|jgi:4-hydroxybenzoate polyprenyltransferase|nr:decaprenyl-phosphate phosphoribosyltransferase [Patescibacteria group bacterium]
MKKILFKTLKLIRPKQWIKNFAIFAAIIFSGQLFDPTLFSRVILGFFAFCAASSAIYIVNDIFDVEKDKIHPFKKFRPLAHGDLSIQYAILLAVILFGSSIFIGQQISSAFVLLLLIYCLLQLSYSIFLKNLTVADILLLATGYMIRVYGGEVATGFHISVWLILTTVALSLFLAVGKRKSELTLISQMPLSQITTIRKTLSHYSESLLNVYASIFATSAFIFYSLFTFLENPQGLKIGFSLLLPDFLPPYLQRKWLMITIVPVVYGLMRYLQDIYEKHEGESPEKVLLSDIPLLSTVVVWVVMVVGIIYFLGG